MQARRHAEQQVEGRRVIEALDSAMASDADEFLSADEKQSLLDLRDVLSARIESGDAASIKAAVDAVEQGSATYVERRMNASVRRMMAGQTVNDIEHNLADNPSPATSDLKN